ncbi:hypothetical protein BYT27DRAFT_7336091 [Phlegmacium glaucopus]|nr:hypothetical protein BYT27DRAFT_7336091 [Phlegmacium glaucopus]
MASLIFKHSINNLKRFPCGSSLSGRRAIHFTSVVHKKKAKVDIDDLFGDEATFEHDLFAESTVEKTVGTAEAEGTSTAQIKRSSTTKRHVSAPSKSFKRSAMINKHIAFMQPRLGSSPSKTQPKIRSRTWLTMMQLAKDGEDMRKVVDLIPKLHEGGGALPGLFAEEFVRRCEQLGCQPLALEVFGNYAKYNITLTPNAGRWLIHSIHVNYPFSDLLIAASLFSVYDISLAEDLVSLSMITAACLKHNTPQSKAMADLLLPKIKRMAKEKKLTTPLSDVEMKRQLKWVDWSLTKINKFVKKASGEPLVPLPAVQKLQPSVVQP